MVKKNAELPVALEKARRGGRGDKAAHHEGPAGAGDVKGSKFSKESRDSVGQKEPGKSRGAGG